jgi:uncharacterized membrane protein YccC
MAPRPSAFRRIMYTDPDLRVSDAERAEVADRLGRHYGDGRLTQEEFNERVDRAMNAKTQSDLSGLFDDLPGLEEHPEVPARRPRRRSSYNHTALILGLVILVAVGAGHAFWWFFMPPWLVIMAFAAVGIYLLRNRERHHREDPERRP